MQEIDKAIKKIFVRMHLPVPKHSGIEFDSLAPLNRTVLLKIIDAIDLDPPEVLRIFRKIKAREEPEDDVLGMEVFDKRTGQSALWINSYWSGESKFSIQEKIRLSLRMLHHEDYIDFLIVVAEKLTAKQRDHLRAEIDRLYGKFERLKKWNLMHTLLAVFQQPIRALRLYHGAPVRLLRRGVEQKKLVDPLFFSATLGHAVGFTSGSSGIGQAVRVTVPLDRIISFDQLGERFQEFVVEPGHYYLMEDVTPERDLSAGLEERSIQHAMKIGGLREDGELAPAAGAEETWMANFLDVLDEAAPQEPGVLVIEAAEISRRMGLAEFVARIPRNMADRLVLFGKDSAEVKEIAARDGIAVVDSDKLSDLAFQLMLLGEEADHVGYMGNPLAAAALSEILPASMGLILLDPGTALDKLLRSLGYSAEVLDAINAAGAEELFAGARAA